MKRIFQGVIEGKPIARIAEELTAERILTPAAHWRAIGERVSMGASGADPYKWATATLIQILKKEEYMGWTVLNKTAKESYKSKKREATPENRLIFLVWTKKMQILITLQHNVFCRICLSKLSLQVSSTNAQIDHSGDRKLGISPDETGL